jgi:hypothetical protein
LKLGETGRSAEEVGLVELLSRAAPEGLRFFYARELGANDPKLSGIINEAVYVAGLPDRFLEQIGIDGIEQLRERIDQRKAGPLEVTRVIDDVQKRVNVSQYLVQVLVGDGAQSLERAGLPPDMVPVTVRLRITGGGTAKVSEALNALLDQPETPACFVRSELLWNEKGVTATPMDLQLLRYRFLPGR